LLQVVIVIASLARGEQEALFTEDDRVLGEEVSEFFSLAHGR